MPYAKGRERPGMAKSWPGNGVRMAILEPRNGPFYEGLMAELAKSRVQHCSEMAISLG